MYPSDKQLDATMQLIEKKRALLNGYCGCGKTIIALVLYYETKKENTNTLLITPIQCYKTGFKQLLENEGIKHKFKEFHPNVLTVCNRESISKLQHCVFNCIIIDESSLFKNTRGRSYSVLFDLTTKAEYVFLLTGTLFCNDLVSVYSQIRLVNPDILPSTISEFTREYRQLQYLAGIVRVFSDTKNSYEYMASKINNLVVEMKQEESEFKLPELNIYLNTVKPSDKFKEQYDAIGNGDFLTTFNFENSLANGNTHIKQLQFCSGHVYNDSGELFMVHDIKLRFIDKVLNYINGENLVIFYFYKFELTSLKCKYPHGVVYKGEKQAKLWNEGKIKILFCSIMQCSHGLNLQYGGHNILFFYIGFSHERFAQAISRLLRRGQKHNVNCFISVFKGLLDYKIFKHHMKSKTEIAKKYFNGSLSINNYSLFDDEINTCNTTRKTWCKSKTEQRE